MTRIYSDNATKILFCGPYFPAFRLNMEIYRVTSCIHSECWKIRTRITPNTGTFYAVNLGKLSRFVAGNHCKNGQTSKVYILFIRPENIRKALPQCKCTKMKMFVFLFIQCNSISFSTQPVNAIIYQE